MRFYGVGVVGRLRLDGVDGVGRERGEWHPGCGSPGSPRQTGKHGLLSFERHNNTRRGACQLEAPHPELAHNFDPKITPNICRFFT